MKNGFKTVTIASSDGSTQVTVVPSRGGALSSMIMAGANGPRELLYVHDYFWDKEINDLPGGWPFCFPVCARLERQRERGQYLYDGKLYQLKIHGFSWYLPWEVSDQTNDSIVLVLRDNAHTRERYPFSFEVELKYQVERGQLTCYQLYRNRSDRAMPYYAGFHPYFLTPLPGKGKESVELYYEPTRRLIYNQSFTDIIGEGNLFSLPISIANSAINEQLTMVGKNKAIQLLFPDGDKIQMIAEGKEDPNLFPFIQLYTMLEKPFMCVEPWMSFPNAMNTVQGVRWLAPQQSEQGVLVLRLLTV